MIKIKPTLLLFLAVISMQAIYWVFVSSSYDTPEHRGLFGDSFGALTALFSGLAFAGMIYAITLQSRELSLQREELKLTREELVATRAEQAKSTEAQKSLVEQQIRSAKINGIASIVQGRYQYAAALGANSHMRLDEVRIAESLLLELLSETEGKAIDLPNIR